jgi:hypothetical protein
MPKIGPKIEPKKLTAKAGIFLDRKLFGGLSALLFAPE